jgi:hypothetical protein
MEQADLERRDAKTRDAMSMAEPDPGRKEYSFVGCQLIDDSVDIDVGEVGGPRCHGVRVQRWGRAS